MNGIPHISTPFSESWVAWLLFGLLLLTVFNRSALTDPREVMRALTSHSDRAYVSYRRNFMAEIFDMVFRVGVLSLTMYLLVYSQGHAFQWVDYAKVAGVVAVVLTVQVLLMYVVGSVFLLPVQLSAAMEQWGLIRQFVSGILWLIMLLMVNWSFRPVLYVCCGVVLLAYAVAVLGKSFMMFYKGVSSLLYILLYFLSLEVVPLCGMMLWAKQIV